MPQLLLELFSEEIPARMQQGAARELERATAERLAKASLTFDRLTAYVGPRRLTLVVDGVPVRQDDLEEERRGPRVGAPEAAVAGFLRATGLERAALIERDGVLYAPIARPGRPSAELIAEIVPAVVTGFSWPKSMTWGAGTLRWVRPLHRILCVFNGEIVPFVIDGLESGDLTEGHRFMAPEPFPARNFDDYRAALEARFVVLDSVERKRRIREGAAALCAGKGLILVEDDGLLEEVAGMAEWPIPILGDMNPDFLSLPPEVIRTTMRVHQRYFAVRAAGEALAPHFITVANIDAPDGGSLIAAGNARVLSARLEDARFFWSEDLKLPLESRLERLRGVTFHAKLGSMRQRAERIEALALQVATYVGADPELASAAGRLAKADLATAMVGEFPELQGIMGGYYAAAEGQAPQVATAIRDHYRPQGPSEEAPSAPTTVAVAIADKLDMILAFFSIGQAPTGSRDPFALRRAALGIIRTLMDNGLTIPLGKVMSSSPFPGEGVLDFFADRLKVLLRERGARHDLVDAVFALGDDDIVRVSRRIDALGAFLATDDGANLLAAYRRAGNILDAEAKKCALPQGPAQLAGPDEEKVLYRSNISVRRDVAAALEREDFAAAMVALAGQRAPVDAFFNNVFVNSPEPSERDNRLRLLAEVRTNMALIADFSRISG